MATDTRAMATTADNDAAILERVITAGDLSRLQPAERVHYYGAVCESVGLNPLTKPFDYLQLNGRLVLYATKTATDQLRSIKGISIDRAERDTSDPEYATWLVTGHDAAGRVDTEIGSVSIKGLGGEAKANAIMKALTKGKRRLTLSLAGLGWLDESEVESIPSAQRADVDQATGEVRQQQAPRQLRDQIAERRAAVTTSAPDAVPTVGAPAAESAAPEATAGASADAAVIDGEAVEVTGVVGTGITAGELREWLREHRITIPTAREACMRLFRLDSFDALTDEQRGHLILELDAAVQS